MLKNDLYEIVREDGMRVDVRLLPESAIYRGHFPGNPVTPGVCQTGMAQELAQTVCGLPLTLREVKSLKFTEVLRPVPDRIVTFSFDTMEDDGNLLHVSGLIRVGETVFTKFSLVFEKVL